MHILLMNTKMLKISNQLNVFCWIFSNTKRCKLIHSINNTIFWNQKNGIEVHLRKNQSLKKNSKTALCTLTYHLFFLFCQKYHNTRSNYCFKINGLFDANKVKEETNFIQLSLQSTLQIQPIGLILHQSL